MKRNHCITVVYLVLYTANLELFECSIQDDRGFTSVHTRQIRSPGTLSFLSRLLRPRVFVLPRFRPEESIPTLPKFEVPANFTEQLHSALLSAVDSALNSSLDTIYSEETQRARAPPQKLLPEVSEPTLLQAAESRFPQPLSAAPSSSLSTGPQSRLLSSSSTELPSSVLTGASPLLQSLPSEAPAPLSADPPSQLIPSLSLPSRSTDNRLSYNLLSENDRSSSEIYQGNTDASSINSVFFDASEFALRLYPGYQIANLTLGGNNNINYINAGSSDFIQYSVGHYGGNSIPADTSIESDLKVCKNITFCMRNTTPLCVRNGTVYCVAPLPSTVACNRTSTEMKCVNSTINLPCNESNPANCNDKAVNSAVIYIPCVTIIGVFTTNVHQTSKRAMENTSSNKYCVTLVVEPIKEREVPLDMSNKEYVQFLKTNDAMKKQAARRFSIITSIILAYIFL